MNEIIIAFWLIPILSAALFGYLFYICWSFDKRIEKIKKSWPLELQERLKKMQKHFENTHR